MRSSRAGATDQPAGKCGRRRRLAGAWAVPRARALRRGALLLLLLPLLPAACARPGAPAPESASAREGAGQLGRGRNTSVPSGLTVRLTVPAATPAGASVYLAGAFNRWNPADSAFRLTREAAGTYALALPDSVRGPIEFKFTLGSWETVETAADGADVPNRSLNVPEIGALTHRATVAAWRAGGPAPARPHTASPSVSILSDSFAMPQLGRTRRVWLYLPPDYATSGKRYPVLYLQDGQNVFDAATSYAGEWGLDETLDSLQARGDPGIIVVAVDHGAARRLDEYSPWKSLKYGGGEGEAYVEFLVLTLKPYVDAHYRTLPDRLHTGIGGSSMGGLISLYAGLKYPDVFGRVLAFSSAIGFAPEVLTLARQATPLRPDPRFYLVMGGREEALDQEAAAIVRAQEQLVDSLVGAGFARGTEVRALVRAEGMHNEQFWRREFPAAYLWLFGRR